MSYLMRIGVGDFKISDSYSIDYIKSLDKSSIGTLILPMDKVLNHMDKLTVDDKYFNKLKKWCPNSITYKSNK